MSKYLPAFRHLGNAQRHNFIGRLTGDIMVFVYNAALLGFDKAWDGFQKGRLSGTIGADDRNNFTFGNFNRNTF